MSGFWQNFATTDPILSDENMILSCKALMGMLFFSSEIAANSTPHMTRLNKMTLY